MTNVYRLREADLDQHEAERLPIPAECCCEVGQDEPTIFEPSLGELCFSMFDTWHGYAWSGAAIVAAAVAFAVWPA